MRWIRFSVIVASLALPCGLMTPVSAQDEPLPEGVTLDFLAFGLEENMPQGADQVFLFRMVLAPDVVYAIDDEGGSVALAEVESGTLSSTASGEMLVSQAGTEPGMDELIPAGEDFTLAEGDSVIFPTDFAGEIWNDESQDVSLLVLEAVSSAAMADTSGEASPESGAGSDMNLPEGVSVELLSFGAPPELSDAGAAFALARVSYDPGVDLPGELQPGSEVSIVEDGEFVLEVTDGPPVTIMRDLTAAVSSGAEPAAETVAAGEETDVAAGDAAYFPAGSVYGASNRGDEPAIALLGFVIPAEEAGM